MKDRILKYIYQYILSTGFAPTYQEIGQGVGLASKSAVANRIQQLQADGLITRHPNQGRTITLTDEGKAKVKQLLQQEKIQ